MATSINFPKLPDDIIYYVMTDFLDMVDLARLDTAMCQRKKNLRTEHLTALGSFLLYPGYLPNGRGGNLQYLNWLALRNISVEVSLYNWVPPLANVLCNYLYPFHLIKRIAEHQASRTGEDVRQERGLRARYEMFFDSEMHCNCNVFVLF
jgi:hypothetical protein